MPTKKTLDDFKSKLGRPALTSHFEVKIPIPEGFSNNPDYLEANGLQQFANINQETLNLLCSEATLPGSNLGTMDITGDFHGATQRFANRRIYDDRIDLTFYVDAENYLAIRYFEVWIKYIVGESISESNGRPGAESPHYFYRLNYPDSYVSKQGLQITKFERDYSSSSLVYDFINAFPVSVTSMPVSYESSSLLKCTVSFTYLRYILRPPTSTSEPAHPDASGGGSSSTTGDPSNPVNQSAFNDPQFIVGSNSAPDLQGTGALSTPVNGFNVGGVPTSAANSSGNAITQSDINTALSQERALATNG
jgi:hypothetical protein